jgi:hypothetical protein
LHVRNAKEETIQPQKISGRRRINWRSTSIVDFAASIHLTERQSKRVRIASADTRLLKKRKNEGFAKPVLLRKPQFDELKPI